MSHSPSIPSFSKLPRRLAISGGLLFVGFLGLGYYGWMETLRHATGSVHHSEIIYHTVELVTGEVAVVASELHSQHWTLFVAKWGIKALLAVAIFQSAAYLLRRRLRRWRFRKVAGHQVFLGLDPINRELARLAMATGERVAVVDADDSHPARAGIESTGSLFLTGSPLDRTLQAAAGVQRAMRVVIGTGDDGRNVTAAEQAGELTRERSATPVEILVPVACPELRAVLRERWALLGEHPACKLRLLGFRAVALRHVLTRIAAHCIRTRPTSGCAPRILLAAPADFALEFLELAVPFLQFSGNVPPRFAVCGIDADGARRFGARHPDIALVADLAFQREAPADAAWCEAVEEAGFDMAVVYAASQTAAITVAGELLCSPLFAVGQVFALVDEPAALRLRPDDRLEVLSLAKYGLQSPEFGNHELEREAQENHDAYLAGLDPEERERALSWATLTEPLKDANRWAVLHRGIKREVWAAAAESDKTEALELLACSEHQRWMAEKILDGWRGGPVRDNPRRIHPDIRPYAELDEPAKEKDRVQVRKALGILLITSNEQSFTNSEQ